MTDTASCSLICFILGLTSVASLIILRLCHNDTGNVIPVLTQSVKAMIVAHAGSGDANNAFASGSSKKLSEAVVTVSMTTGAEVDW